MELSACIVVYNGADEALRAAQTVLDCTRRHPLTLYLVDNASPDGSGQCLAKAAKDGTLHIREGDPLEIYTEKDGEVIFKKYSPMGDLQNFAVQMCDAIGKNTGHIAAVSDRDSIIALAGAPRRELLDKPNSADLEQIMERRKCYRYTPGSAKLRAAETADRYHLGIAAPIVSQGDLMGCVMLLMDEHEQAPGEGDQRLAQTVAGFLAKQMEN